MHLDQNSIESILQAVGSQTAERTYYTRTMNIVIT